MASAAPPRGERREERKHVVNPRPATSNNNTVSPRGEGLPAGVLVLLAVHEGAGLQLAAHQRGAVVAHGRVPRRALRLGVAVDAGDWREEEAVSSPSDKKRRRKRRRRRVTEAEQNFLLFKGDFNKIIALCESVIMVTFIHFKYVEIIIKCKQKIKKIHRIVMCHIALRIQNRILYNTTIMYK